MQTIKDTIKDCGIIKLNGFWERAKTSAQLVKSQIDTPKGDAALKFMYQDSAAAVSFFKKAIKKMAKSGEDREAVMEKYGTLFLKGKLGKIDPKVVIQKLDKLSDYIDSKIEELDDETKEELSDLFEDAEEEVVEAAAAGDVVDNGLDDRVNAFLRSETSSNGRRYPKGAQLV